MSETARNASGIASSIQTDVNSIVVDPTRVVVPTRDEVVTFTLVRGTRGYIESIVRQINGCYSKGWYDASAVMLRRLVETLIIEAFESQGKSSQIGANNSYIPLERLVEKAKNDLRLGRDSRRVLDEVKVLGDNSAHNRRYIATRSNIETNILKIKILVQELTKIAGLKN